MRHLLLLISWAFCYIAHSQTTLDSLYGTVVEQSDNIQTPLEGAVIYWQNTSATTMTDEYGKFQLPYTKQSQHIVVQYIGYGLDTIFVPSSKANNAIKIVLSIQNTTKEVVIIEHVFSTKISTLNPLKVEQIGETEFKKAACCNLAESFENTPTIEVAYSDAMTGAKQIQMLGLNGIYVQNMYENVPWIRTVAANYGLSFVPGIWVKNIYLNKGTGSVANGYESITGQINMELKGYAAKQKNELNVYLNNQGRLEGNILLHQKINKNMRSSLFLHANSPSRKMDSNKDNFYDNTIGHQYNVLNKWDWNSAKGWEGQFGIQAIHDLKTGGQIASDTTLWTTKMLVKRLQVYSKSGYVWKDNPNKSIGLQVSSTYHDQKDKFGTINYDILTKNITLNLLFQTCLKEHHEEHNDSLEEEHCSNEKPPHIFKFGTTVVVDNYTEFWKNTRTKRTEKVAGVSSEYTFTKNKIAIVAGIRVDKHNLFGVLPTARLHAKYSFNPTTTLRIAAGNGYRTTNIIADNMGLLASNRNWTGLNNTKTYDLESAYNVGINIVKEVEISGKKGVISIDLYRTQFLKQIVIDREKSAQDVYYYALKNKESYSNSIQLQLDYELAKGLDIRLAYRYYDVKTKYDSIDAITNPFISAHRGFINVSYTSRSKWSASFTSQFIGSKRVPPTTTNPVAYQAVNKSPYYTLVNAQVGRDYVWGRWYVGIENALNYTQKNPIIAADKPYSRYLDSSLVWGPINGAQVYTGVVYLF